MTDPAELPTQPAEVVVLVVEDEILVRLAAAEDLREAGFTVLEASTGEEGLALLDAGLPVEVVFTDVQMPGRLDGTALVEAVAVRHPQVRCVITSGVARPLDGTAVRSTPFLPKPYTARELVAAIAAVAPSGRRRS